MRYHLDEHVATAVALGLRRRGIDVSTTVEAGLVGATDEAQLLYCVSEKRVLVTQDDDFLAMVSEGTSHPGIVYAHQHTCGIGDFIEALVLIDACLTSDQMTDHIEFI